MISHIGKKRPPGDQEEYVGSMLLGSLVESQR